MHSRRFDRSVVLTRHARMRMDERNISEAELLSVIDTGQTHYKDASHLWAFKHMPSVLTTLFARCWCSKIR